MNNTRELDDDRVDRLYRASRTPAFVEVPALPFLAIDGHGDPNSSQAFADAVKALYAVSYAAKFAIKKAGGENYKVAPLEGLWTADGMEAFRTGTKRDWDWTAMIRQPESVTRELVEQAVDDAATRKGLTAARTLRLERSPRDQRPRCSTSARTPTRGRRSPGCTTSSTSTDSPSTATCTGITRSTSATRAARPRRGCARSSDSRTPGT